MKIVGRNTEQELYRGLCFLRVVVPLLLFDRLWTRFCFLTGREHDFALQAAWQAVFGCGGFCRTADLSPAAAISCFPVCDDGISDDL